MSDQLKVAIVVILITVGTNVAYRSEVAIENQQGYDTRLAKVERSVNMYLPPIDCSHCHNMRVGATKGGYK